MQGTYYVRYGRVLRTPGSIARKERRVEAKTLDAKFWSTAHQLAGNPARTAQEVADEKHLSRSKTYFRKGINETLRRASGHRYTGNGA